MRTLRSNSCDYFPHLSGMRNHRKVKVLRNRFGQVLGYAFWSMLLEYLTELDGQEMECTAVEIEMFAAELGATSDEVRQMIDVAVGIELLFRRDNFIYSESLNAALAPVYIKRKRERERSAARVRREDGQFISAAEKPQTDVNLPQDEPKKTEKQPKQRKEASGVHAACIRLYDEFYRNQVGVAYPFNGGADATAMKRIIAYLMKIVLESKGTATEDQILEAWNAILSNYNRWDQFHRGQLKLSQVQSNLANIIISIKKNGNGNSKAEQRIADWAADTISRFGAESHAN